MMVKAFLLVNLFLAGCSKDLAPASSGDTIKILFVGNSLTYTNDLPAMVREMGNLDGKIISYYSILLPGYSLEDHWNTGNVQAEIEKGGYDFVVAQQGPSALPESQSLLLEYAGRFAKICRDNNSKMALFMVWPSKARLFDLDSVIYSYKHAAEITGSLVCPAGLGWKYAWEANSALVLYGPDDFHPGIDGSVLAALVIYGTLAKKSDFDFLDYQKCSWKNDMDKKTLALLKEAATRALQ
ncbi:MAG: SGNH/GDSL hydrolase family protein [Ferruginibacter sp.]|nr:SGNH/GDSL hydrolase family protein [Chitinophagaceae bacterium]